MNEASTNVVILITPTEMLNTLAQYGRQQFAVPQETKYNYEDGWVAH